MADLLHNSTGIELHLSEDELELIRGTVHIQLMQKGIMEESDIAFADDPEGIQALWDLMRDIG